MVCGDDIARMLLYSALAKQFSRLVNGRRYCQYPDTLGDRREFDDGGQHIASGPRLVWNQDGVHELPWPCILDLKGLLIFERFGGENAENGYRDDRLQVVCETRTYGHSPELVAHTGTAIAVDAGWQRATQLELEWELMDSGLEGAAVTFFALQERPLMVTEGVPL